MSSAYVGNRVQNLDISEALDKVTRVVLVVDSDHVYTAGNDTGRTIEREIPWGSQAMADALLRKLSGVEYNPFNAERAMISPAFEIGDPITIGGVYSRIIGADINYAVSGLVDLYAPDLDVTDDEYPAEKTQQSSIERQLAQARSLISKTAEEIRLEVSGLDDKYTALSVTIDGVTISDSDGQTLIKGSSIDTDTIKANSITADKLNLSGAITFEDLDTAVKNTIDSANDTVSAWQYGNTTFIDGSKLMTGTVMASKLLGGSVGLLTSDQVTVGSLDIAYTTTGYGLQMSTNYGGLLLSSAGNWWVSAAYGEMGITSSGIVCGAAPVPQNGTVTLGTYGFPWADIYTAYGKFSDLVARVAALENA